MDVQNQETETRWNGRYLAYSRAHGRSPEAMLAHDDDAWPGGRMCGFMLWLRSQWRRWAAERGGTPDILTPEHHADFDAWLERPYRKCPAGTSSGFSSAMARRNSSAEARGQSRAGIRD